MPPGFVHLHVHSDYSLLDGACKIHDLLDKCQKFGMNACALTDHGNLFGAVEFYQEAKKRGIKPVIGSELYVSPTNRFDKSANSAGTSNHHFLLLCENTVGYHNLCRLSSMGYLEGFHYKPRVDDDLLAQYSEGLIATSACLGGRIPQAILNNNLDAANESIKKYIRIFGKDNFLIELMDHGMPEQERVNPILAQMAEDHGLMLIATNDCHYLDKEDAEAHEALLCVQTGSTLDDPKHFKFPKDDFYFCSPDEMAQKFTKWPHAIRNTQAVAQRCNVDIPLAQSLIPEFVVPDGEAKPAFMRRLVLQGLKERYGDPTPPEFIARAEFEMDVIERMKFLDYFLVVWDLIDHAREQGIPVGPGRGSGAGSIVAYALKITNIDPMRYNLLFERFLNPERISMPDFDIDFCYNRRDEMIAYCKERYGEKNVSQIITFGRMLARNVIRNVGRVLGMSYGDVDRIAKLIPEELKITLATALEKEPELKRIIEADPQVAKLWKLAERLEGTIGNCGTHAAGVVICDHPLTDHVALFKASGSDTITTQVEMKCVEEVGLLKMDFLGLRTLTVVHEAVRLIEAARGIKIHIDAIEPNDEKAYAILRSGNTSGIFQLESSGMRDLAKRIGLQSLEEMSALVALFRPGPMQFIDTYIQNKFHPEKIAYDHTVLEEILKETYGIAVYQEQVMQIVQACAGFTLGQADILRRAMGKKKADLMAEQRSKFVEGCKKTNNIDAKLAATLFDKIETFAGYGFNKSHSVAYAFVAYQTAFLKANYPVEFMCALLTSEAGNLDKCALYVEECRRMNIKVLPPDVNSSVKDFAVDGLDIRFGLNAIKNVGTGPTDAIVREREANGPFKDIYDFCARLEGRLVNRRLVESLNKAGAFESTGWNRRQVEACIEQALSQGQSAQRDRAAGQFSLFEMDAMSDTSDNAQVKPALPEWSEHELLQYEKEMLGLYVSSHPLAAWEKTIRNFTTLRLAQLPEMKEGQEILLGGLVGNAKIHITGKGAKMAFLTLETLEGSCEMIVFSDLYETKNFLLIPDTIVLAAARVSQRNGENGLIATNIHPIAAADQCARALHLRIDHSAAQDGLLERVALALGEAPGACDVYLHLDRPGQGEIIVHATPACRVSPTHGLREKLDQLLGDGAAWYSAGMGLPTHEPPKPAMQEQPRWKQKKAVTP